MENALVLICDDNPAIQKSLSGYFEEIGVQILAASTGREALACVKERKPSLVILDVMLPDMCGTDVCLEIRKTSNVPILMLSAKAEEIDRIVGLEVGADDYVTKPFSPREVYIRCKKMLKRSCSIDESKKYTLGELTILPDSFEVYVGDQNIKLALKEFEVLRYLAAHAGKAMTREHIINTVWGYEYMGETRIVDTLIKRLRHKLFAGQNQHLHFDITTVFGVGYKLEELP